MEYEFARINLTETRYRATVHWQQISEPTHETVQQLQQIYREYCAYKKFKSVMPIFVSEFYNPSNDIIGYYDQSKLVAFSLLRRYDDANVESVQFAWNYCNPKLRLGIESLKTECAIYRDREFQYLYLDYAHEYKKHIQGFEILGPVL